MADSGWQMAIGHPPSATGYPPFAICPNRPSARANGLFVFGMSDGVFALTDSHQPQRPICGNAIMMTAIEQPALDIGVETHRPMNLLFLAITIGLALELALRLSARRPQAVRIPVRVTPRRPKSLR